MDEASLVGTTLADRYHLLEVIGEGGMGRVFRAQQLSTGRIVALKVLNPEVADIDEALQRFKREAKVTTRLSHPHIVRVVEFGESDGRLFLAMELLAGESLAALIERGAPPRGQGLGVARTIAIMRPVLEALEYAHARGVVHRDLKPENVMVAPARGLLSREAVKVLDFGIAKLGNDAQSSTQKLTRVGLLLGTPSYMSPEQAVGQPADARSDIYSCGVILYEMLTGQRPFAADLPVQVLSMQLNATPRSLRAVAPEARIPLAIEAVVLRALAKRPSDRFQSASELRRALGRAARARDRAAVSGFDETVMALPKAQPSPLRWMPLTIIALSVAMLIGDHRSRPKTPGSPRRIVSSEAGSAAPRAREPVPATKAAPARARARRSAPAAARAPSRQTKQAPAQRQAPSKKRP